MDFSEVLSKTWHIIWKHKILWIFGIMAGCGAGGMRGSNTGYQLSRGDTNLGGPAIGIERFFDSFGRIPDWAMIAIVVGIVVFILLLILLTAFVGTMGRVGLIRGAQQADQDVERLTFGELFRGSVPYFWRVFAFNLLAGLAALVAVLIIFMPMIPLAMATRGFVILCILPLVCLLIPLSGLVSAIIEQANVAIVVEDVGIVEGVRRAWKVFKTNFGTMILMVLILYFAVGMIGGIIISLPIVAIFLPPMFGAAFGSERSMWAGMLTAMICIIAYLPVLILLAGILRSYFQVGWTLTYLRLRPKATEPGLFPLTEAE